MSDFVVRTVGECETEDGVYTIAMSEDLHPDSDSRSVSFSCGGDVGADEEPYEVTEEPGQATMYGGVASWGLKDRRLVVLYSGGGVQQFDLGKVSEADVNKVEKGLARALVGVPRNDRLVEVPLRGR
jgi:hypothetical protein